LAEQTFYFYTLREQVILLSSCFAMLETNADERISRRRTPQPMRYLLLLIAAMYVALGAFLMAAPAGLFNLSTTGRRIGGSMLILFGLIRFVRTFRQHFRKRHDSAQR
jgi:cytochrome c biogenesis protein CcdA